MQKRNLILSILILILVGCTTVSQLHQDQTPELPPRLGSTLSVSVKTKLPEVTKDVPTSIQGITLSIE